MFGIPFLISADPHLGRLDYESLSDQTRMEILFEGMRSYLKKRIQDESGDFKDVCAWRTQSNNISVTCGNDRVQGISVVYGEFSADQFPFKFIPPLVTKFSMEQSKLHGTLDTSVLPSGLTEFAVPSNDLHGEIDFSAFPRNLIHINICQNGFEGSCALDKLPDSVQTFYAIDNFFSGEIPINALPKALFILLLISNQLCGPLHIERLPVNIQEINLSQNCFTGELRLLDIPQALSSFEVQQNPLCSRAVLASAEGRMHFALRHSTFDEIFDENGDKHAWADEILELYKE